MTLTEKSERPVAPYEAHEKGTARTPDEIETSPIVGCSVEDKRDEGGSGDEQPANVN